MKHLNIGIIGPGGHAEQSHIPHLYQAPDTSITMLADLKVDRAEAINDKFQLGAKVTGDWTELLKSDNVDVIFETSLDELHLPHMLGAIKARKHVFVEKPMAVSMEQYRQLRAALGEAAARKLQVSTCHPRRRDKPFVNSEALLTDRGKLANTFGVQKKLVSGKVTAFHLNLDYSPPENSGKHEDFFIDHGPHELDTANHFFGRAGLRSARTNRNNRAEFDVEAVRDDGIKLHFTGNRKHPTPKTYNEQWHVTFDNGVIFSVNAHTGELALAGAAVSTEPIVKQRGKAFQTDYDGRFSAVNRNFLAAIRGKETPYLTHQEMLFNNGAALILRQEGVHGRISL